MDLFGYDTDNLGSDLGQVGKNVMDAYNYIVPGSKDVYRQLGLYPKDPAAPAQMSDAEIQAFRRQQKLINDQKDQLDKFDANRDSFYNQSVGTKDLAIQRALQNRLTGVREDAANRGLLSQSSGSRELGESQAYGGAAGQRADSRMGINKALMSMREKMQSLYDKMRFDKYQDSVLTADNLYDQAMSDFEAASAQGSSNMQGMGSMGGFAAGGGFKGSQEQQKPTGYQSGYSSNTYGNQDYSGSNYLGGKNMSNNMGSY